MATVVAAIAIVLLLVVCLALMGVMHEVTVLQGSITALNNLLINPPGPRFFNGALPERTVARLRERGVPDDVAGFALVFVRQACPACSRLLQGIADGVEGGTLQPNQFVCVLGGHAGGLDKHIREAALPVIIDEDKLLLEGCQVKQTPTVLHLDRDLKVLDTLVGDDIEWIQSRLGSHFAEPTAKAT